MERVRPGLELGIIRAQSDILSSDLRLEVEYKDSNCSDKDGMNQAINFYLENKTDVYFGPMCDYAAAPVARQVTYWNMPMVTTLGWSRVFRTGKADYPLLTTAGTLNVVDMMLCFTKILEHFNWKVVKLLYENEGMDHIMPKFGHILADGLVYLVKAQENDYYRLGNDTSTYYESILRKEVGKNYAGKSC